LNNSANFSADVAFAKPYAVVGILQHQLQSSLHRGSYLHKPAFLAIVKY
jgi:hypothetical protein